MADEIKNGNDEVLDQVIYDDDNDPDWDNVTWGKDDEDESDTGNDDIDDKAEPETDQTKEPPAEDNGPAEDKPSADAEDADQYLELKHFDEIRKVGKDEAKVLAQKGLDYDNIRSERDTFRSERDAARAENARYKEMEAFLNEMKGDHFDSVDDLIADTRARLRAEKNGTAYEDELAKIKNGAAQKEEPKSEPSPSPVDEFLRRFPGVKAEDIPESVWAETRETGDLAGAYAKYKEAEKEDEIKKLKDEIEALKQNQKNKDRSAGSSRSAGASKSKSTIAELWDNGE